MPVASIDTPAIARALASVQAEYPKQARRVLSALARVLDFAKVNGWRTGDNPATFKSTFAYLWPPVKNDTRHAAMPYRDVPAFMARLLAVPTMVKLSLAFTVLTGARTQESLGARHSEILGDLWVLSATRTKQRREHRVPLTPAALEVIALAKALAVTLGLRGNDFVFPTDRLARKRGGQLSGRCMERCLHRDMQETGSIHGFRASLRTYLGSETNVDFTTAEQVLGHNVGDATVQAYLRGASLTKMRIALQLWPTTAWASRLSPTWCH
jgi:integrase